METRNNTLITKKLTHQFIAICMLLSIFGGSGLVPISAKEWAHSLQEGDAVYKDPEFKYELSYPSGWTLQNGTLVDAHNLIWEVRILYSTNPYIATVVSAQPIEGSVTSSREWAESILGRSDLTEITISNRTGVLASSNSGETLSAFLVAEGYGYRLTLQEQGDYPEHQENIPSDIIELIRTDYMSIINTFALGTPDLTIERAPEPEVNALAIADGFGFPMGNKQWEFGYAAHPTFWTGEWSSCFNTYKENLYHFAEDWANPAGTTVYAVANGIVDWYDSTYSGWPGRIVIVKHTLPDNSTIYSLYGHLNSVYVTANQTINKGTPIGTILDQGSNSHVHWEMRTLSNGPYPCSGTRHEGRGYSYPEHPNSLGFSDPTDYVNGHQGGGNCSLTSIPSGYNHCADEGGTCSFSGTADVIYGANSCYTSPRSFSGGTACNNDVFGDPISGMQKKCYTNASGPPPSGNWNAKYFNGHDHWWDNNNFNNQMCEQNINSSYLDVNYGSGSPCNNGVSDNWTAEYNATINFSAGNYVIYAQNDDGLKIWVNGSNIMERGGSSGYYPRCPALYLSGNTPIRAILREEGGDARVKIAWGTDTSVCTPPGSFNKSSPSSGATDASTSPTLIWGSSSNATSYHYCIDTSNNNNCDAGWQSNGTSTSKALSGLTAGTTYYWQARANNEGGEVFANGGTWWSFTTQSSIIDSAQFISQSAYPTVAPGSSLQIFFTIKNTGTSTWQPGSYWLQNLQYPLGANTQQALSQSVSPNGTYTWTINQTAPNTPGTYRSQWMISHNGTTFGPNMFIDVTVQSATINLLSNGGFENGSSSPTSWSQDAWQSTYSTFVWDTAQKHLGNKSVKIVNNTANDARWIQTVSVAPNTDYRLSGWIKTQDVQNNGDRGANLSILDTWISTPKLKGTNDWTFVSIDFNSEAMTSVRVAVRLGMYSGEIGGTAWFDDLKLEPLNVTTYTVFLPYAVRP